MSAPRDLTAARKPSKAKAWVGKRVLCRGRKRTVVRMLPDIDGGVMLDRPVEGFTCWNVSDLTDLSGTFTPGRKG